MTSRRRLAAMVITALVMLGSAVSAQADGDPGSDVLVNQSLFLAADSGISVASQVQLGRLITAADRAGMPIRVAIIAKPADLGTVTPLWNKPEEYARYLGIELSLAYHGRLLVVMPEGFGFNWPKHGAIGAYAALGHVAHGPSQPLAARTEAAISALAAAAHVPLMDRASTTGATRTRGALGSSTGQAAPAVHHAPGGTRTLAFIVLILLALAAVTTRVALRRRGRGLGSSLQRIQPSLVARRLPLTVLAAMLVLAGVGYAVLPRSSPRPARWSNPLLDPGTSLARVAPAFQLSDQFGQPVRLSSFRGKVVVLAFIDSECTTMCPLTSQAMLEAKAMLGSSGKQLQLVGIDANPRATALQDVLAYSQVHGMLHSWDFLTGSLPALRRVWRDYSIDATISRQSVDHTPAIFMISPGGTLVREYIVQQSYAAVGQLGQLIATDSAKLLASHPRVSAKRSYKLIPGLYPTSRETVPRAGGGSLTLGPGAPRLLLFFDTWDRQITDLGGGLEGLDAYATDAARHDLPELTAIDEGAVEPAGALGPFLRDLPKPLSYPVGVDTTGRLADGYEVEGEPWLMLVGGTGRIEWYYSVAALGWPSRAKLVADIRKAQRLAGHSPSRTTVPAKPAHAPAPLAKLQQQASQVLGAYPALAARIRALRGYPIVINIWASWCVPCRSEFGLFRGASARYGSRVAFIGADTEDTASDAQSFLHQHHVDYPSYSVQSPQLTSLLPGGVETLPTTVYIDAAGKVRYVHSGQYGNQRSLDADITAHTR